MTPRKPKQRQQNHRHTPSGTIQVSDYESDAQIYNNVHIPPPTRTNTELNLSVLRRYNPAIRNILSIAASATIYLFTPATQAWEKSGAEGTLFVCDQDSNVSTSEPGYCVVVLNRRGLDNLILHLSQTQDVEVTSELLIMRFQDKSADSEEQKILGIWFHEDKQDTREVNATLIQQCWEKAMASKAQYTGSGEAMGSNGNGAYEMGNGSTGIGGAAIGRRVSLTDLFGQQSSQEI